MNRSPAARRAAETAGRRGETWAAWLLRCKGYRILARRVRTAAGEIDLVARRNGTLVFVEVKRRADLVLAAESITPRQRDRIDRAARIYLAAHPKLAQGTVRFDIVLVAPRQIPRHIVNAFDASF